MLTREYSEIEKPLQVTPESSAPARRRGPKELYEAERKLNEKG